MNPLNGQDGRKAAIISEARCGRLRLEPIVQPSDRRRSRLLPRLASCCRSSRTCFW